jgi:hypothetical protein
VPHWSPRQCSIWSRWQSRLTTRWTPVVHTCNPSDSGGRDQEDQGLKQPRQ